MKTLITALFTWTLVSSPVAFAGPEAFHAGPLIEGHGKIADVPDALAIPGDAEFRVAFDVADAADAGAVNRDFDTVARFLNMHAAAGVPAERLQAAVVVHGGAHRDLLKHGADGVANPNAGLVEQLLRHGVSFQLCGQTAAYYGVTAGDLLPGVRLSLSAMTAHALLQQQGFTLNPF